MNLVIIGMRGAGKSNISRRISVLTKWPVVSTDLLISYEAEGRTIPEILDADGGDWRSFRDREHAVVQKVASLNGVIIDCGGGMVVDLNEAGEEVYSRRKMDALKRTGHVLWLRGDIDRLAAKVANDPSRPELDARRGAAEIMRRRLPFYEEAADQVVDIDGERRKVVARRIVDQAIIRMSSDTAM